MAYLQLAEGRKKKTHVSPYWRNAHYTEGHTRHLNGRGLLSDGEKLFYMKVPDPENKLQPVFVREDFFDLVDDSDFAKLVRFVTPFNDQKHLQALSARRVIRNAQHGTLNDGALLSDLFGTIMDVVNVGANLIPGGGLVTDAIGFLTGSTSTGQPTHQPVVTVSPQPDTYSDLTCPPGTVRGADGVCRVPQVVYRPSTVTTYSQEDADRLRREKNSGAGAYVPPPGTDPIRVRKDSQELQVQKGNIIPGQASILTNKTWGIPNLIFYPGVIFAGWKLLLEPLSKSK